MEPEDQILDRYSPAKPLYLHEYPPKSEESQNKILSIEAVLVFLSQLHQNTAIQLPKTPRAREIGGTSIITCQDCQKVNK
jgi:hypothetical protein